jgi:hypothetical protein
MAKYLIGFVFSVYGIRLFAQQLHYHPEIFVGHRAVNYMQTVNVTLNKKLTLNNLTLFDTEYASNTNNIYFIRNMMVYHLTSKLKFNVLMGVKNPGSFVGAGVQYALLQPNYSLMYYIGATYQQGFTLEQALRVEYTPRIADHTQVYSMLLAMANLNTSEYQRGLLYMRLGLKHGNVAYGAAFNVDQFNNNSKSLENVGSFIKYNF